MEKRNLTIRKFFNYVHSSICIQTFIFSIAILSVVLPKSAEAFETNFLNFETLNFETKPYVETYLEYIDVAGASMLDFASSGKSLATRSVESVDSSIKNLKEVSQKVSQEFGKNISETQSLAKTVVQNATEKVGTEIAFQNASVASTINDSLEKIYGFAIDKTANIFVPFFNSKNQKNLESEIKVAETATTTGTVAGVKQNITTPISFGGIANANPRAQITVQGTSLTNSILYPLIQNIFSRLNQLENVSSGQIGGQQIVQNFYNTFSSGGSAFGFSGGSYTVPADTSRSTAEAIANAVNPIAEEIAGLSVIANSNIFASIVATSSATSTFAGPITSDDTITASAFFGDGSNLTGITSFSTSTTRGVFSNIATGLGYDSATGITSLTSGYNIPLTASTTEWASKVGSQWITSGSDIYYNTGNVGVGITSPSQKLDVGGNILAGSGAGSAYIYLRDAYNYIYNADGLPVDVKGHHGVRALNDSGEVARFGTAGDSLNSYFNGNVGIGTVTPGYKLDVNGGSNQWGANIDVNYAGDGGLLVTNNSSATWGAASIHMVNNDGNYFDLFKTGSAYGSYKTIGNNANGIFSATGAMNFLADDATNGIINFTTGGHSTADLTILTNGNVGIGTTSPSAKLAITGSGTGTGRAFTIADSANAEKFTVLDNGNTKIYVGATSPIQFGQNASYSNFGAISLNNTLSDSGMTGFFGGGDSNFYFNTPNNIVLRPGGSGANTQFRMTSSGLILGGTGDESTAATNRLDVAGAVAIGSYAQTSAPTNGLIVSGNVGIGTTNPGERLQVSGAIRTSGPLASWLENSGSLSQETSSPAGTWLSSAGPDHSTRGTINFYIAGSGGGSGLSAMTINNQGNVGIGTTNPTAQFQVSNYGLSPSTFYTGGVVSGLKLQNQTTNGRSMLGIVPNGTSNLADVWLYETSDTTTNYGAMAWGFDSTANAWGWNAIKGGTGTARPFYFNATNGQSAGTANLYLATSGNVGIGTTSPDAKLTIKGEGIRLTNSDVSNIADGRLLFGDASSAGVGWRSLVLGNNIGSTFSSNAPIQNTGIGGQNSASAISLSNDTNGGRLGFQVWTGSPGAGGALTPRLNIDFSGNVGIGTTTPSAKLAITGTAGAGDIFAIASSTNARLFTVTSGGRVGIGTTTPSAKLDVAGNIQTSGVLNFATSTTSGLQTLTQLGGSRLASIGTSGNSTFFGLNSGGTSLSAAGNTGFGASALSSITSGYRNVAVGRSALESNLAGADNTALGDYSLPVNTTGTSNFAGGYASLLGNIDGSQNVAIGTHALAFNISGSSNIGLGYQSLYSNTAGSNIGVGYRAGYYNTSGTNNLFLGSQAGFTDGTVATTNNLSNATAIGYNAQVTASNSLILGGTGAYAVNVGIGTTAPSGLVSLGTSSGKKLLLYDTGSVNTSAGLGIQSDLFEIAGGVSTVDYTIGYGTSGSLTRLLTVKGTTGNVGIGTTTPTSKLAVAGAITASHDSSNIGVSSHYSGSGGRKYDFLSCYNCGSGGLGGLEIYDATAEATRAYITAGVNGWQTPSDLRLKEDVQTLTVLDKLDLVRGTIYNLKDSGVPQIGVIAQEIKLAFPEAVSGEEVEGRFLGVSYNAIASIALQGIKELNDVFNAMKERIDGVLAWFSMSGDRFNVKGMVCVDDVCVTKDQFKQLLINSAGAVVTPTQNPDPTPSSTPTSAPIDNEVVPTDDETTPTDNETTSSDSPDIETAPVVENPSAPEVIPIPEPAPVTEPSTEPVSEPAPSEPSAPTPSDTPESAQVSTE